MPACARKNADRGWKGAVDGFSPGGAAALGLSFEDMLGIVMGLTPMDFCKSMTTHADHRVWQDVYRPFTSVGAVYLKLTIVDDVLIVSFKES